MKKIALFTLFLFALTASPVFAQRNLHEVIAKDTPPILGSHSGQKLIKITPKVTPSNQRVANLRDRANKEIDRRIVSLNNLIAKINSLKKISDSQKSTFVNQIQAEITNLTNLKAKIAADTDYATLKTDVQSIVKSYRVYLLFVPKIDILVAADRLDNIADQLGTISAKLKSRINDAKAKGDDISNLQLLLTDMNAKITDIHTQADKVRNLVISLTPAGYPGNKGILQSARAVLNLGRKDIQTSRQDGLSIIQGLKVFIKLHPSLTPSPTVSIAPTPTQ